MMSHCILNFSLMKNKGDLERECDVLKAELDNYNNKVQVLERTVEHLKKTIDEKVFRAVNSFIYKIMRPFRNKPVTSRHGPKLYLADAFTVPNSPKGDCTCFLYIEHR